jgi:hypothetical protein
VVVLESSRTVIFITASVKEDERPRSQFRKAIASVCHVKLRCEQAFFLHQASSTFCFFSLSAIDGRIEQLVCITFCVKIGKSAAENLETLHDAFGEHSLSRTASFEWLSRLKADRVSVEDDERLRQPSTSKTTEMLNRFVNSSMKTVAEQSISSHRPSGSVEHAPHCREDYSPTFDK